MPNGETQTVNINTIDLDYNALLRFKQDGEEKLL